MCADFYEYKRDIIPYYYDGSKPMRLRRIHIGEGN